MVIIPTVMWNGFQKASSTLNINHCKSITMHGETSSHKGLINQQNNRETLVSMGIHFVRGVISIHSFFQLNARATGSLATDSAMMQDWRGTDLQFHSAGEEKSTNVSCCRFSKLLKVVVIRATVSYLREWQSTIRPLQCLIRGMPKTPFCF